MARTPRVPGVVEPKPEPIAEAADTTVTDSTPNACDVDPRAITSPVLTKQGWVCPVPGPNPRPGF